MEHKLASTSKEVQTSHPLELRPVVKNIFKYLRIKDITSCREVCREWRSEAMKILASRINEVQFHFDEISTISQFLKSNSGSGLECSYFHFAGIPMNHKVTLDLWSRIQSSIRILELSDYEYNNYNSMNLNKPMFRDILQNKAPNLQELYLKEKIPGVTDEGALWIDSSPIPELQLSKIGIHLHHDREYYMEPPDPNYDMEFLKDLFRASPKLKSLILTSNYDSGEDEMEILESFVPVFEEGVGNLTELQIGKLPWSNFRAFNRVGSYFQNYASFIFPSLEKADAYTIRLIKNSFASAPLEELTIQSIESFNDRTFLAILNDHKSTLNQLKFIFQSHVHKLSFPAMINLTKLEFGAHDVEGIESPPYFCGTIQGDSFPNLVTLNLIDEMHAENYENGRNSRRLFDMNTIFPLNGTPIQTLRNLRLPPAMSVEGLQKAGVLFPKVKRLWLGPQKSEVLTELWNTWTDSLEMFTLSLNLEYYIPIKRSCGPFRGTIDDPVGALGEERQTNHDLRSYDSIITGIPEDQIKAIKENFAKTKQLPTTEELAEFLELPSISNHKKLSNVQIYNGTKPNSWYTWRPSSKYTDISLKLGFSLLHELKYLGIGSEVVEMSEEAIQDICSTSGLMRIQERGSLKLVKYDWQETMEPEFGLAFQDIPEYTT